MTRLIILSYGITLLTGNSKIILFPLHISFSPPIGLPDKDLAVKSVKSLFEQIIAVTPADFHVIY